MENKKMYHVWLEADKGEGMVCLWKVTNNVEEIEIPTWMFSNVLIKITYEQHDGKS